MKKITIKIDNYNLNSIDNALKEANEYLNNKNPDKVYSNLTIVEERKNIGFRDFANEFVKKNNLESI